MVRMEIKPYKMEREKAMPYLFEDRIRKGGENSIPSPSLQKEKRYRKLEDDHSADQSRTDTTGKHVTWFKLTPKYP